MSAVLVNPEPELMVLRFIAGTVVVGGYGGYGSHDGRGGGLSIRGRRSESGNGNRNRHGIQARAEEERRPHDGDEK